MPSIPWKSRPYLVLILCTFIILISYGTRQSFGLFLIPISDTIAGGRVEPFSFAVSLQTLIVGLSVPFVSAIADKWLGPVKMLVAGGALYAVGMFLLGHASSEMHLTLSVGVLSGLAAAGCGLPMLLSVVGRVAPEKRRSLWLGIVSAGGTGGQMFLVPLNGYLLERMDWTDAIIILAAFIFAIVPMAFVAGKSSGEALDQKKDTQTLGQALQEARGHKSFTYLCLGFFTCGFQVQFVVTHLPKYLEDTGTGATIGAHAIALIGLTNVIGTAVAGMLGGKYKKKNLLAGLYIGRSLVMLAFFLAPVTQMSVYIFAASIGFLWLATVPLTAGLVSGFFGPRYMATLYAIAFLSHQIGGFLSTWMGGIIRDATGSYDQWWWVIIFGGMLAALFHLPIKERPVERLAQPA
ncbi:MAG: MFS transporter [Alphaproteobacteria bacterium]|nr:MFS transporter [Alphaproteobacteria bacterium]